MGNAVFVGHVLLDCVFPSCAEIFLIGLLSRLATQCSSVSDRVKIVAQAFAELNC